MTAALAHTSLLYQEPFQRQFLHGRAAMDQLSLLLDLLPAGGALRQMQALQERSEKDPRDPAVEAWGHLVRGYALDFHDDAGAKGKRWQHAVIDAWETWLLLRKTISAPSPSWPWQWSQEDMVGQGVWATEMEDEDPNTLVFGTARADKTTDLSDWRRALARMPAARACADSLRLLEAWPGCDVPSLALATGALWAIGLPGSVVGVESLLIGGVQGEDGLLHTRWL